MNTDTIIQNTFGQVMTSGVDVMELLAALLFVVGMIGIWYTSGEWPNE